MKIERPKTGYTSMKLNKEGTLRTYHNINGLWGEQLFNEGEWAIYKPMLREVRSGGAILSRTATINGYNCAVVHSRIWEDSKTTMIEHVCHTTLYPVKEIVCSSCRATIPKGIIALWKMLNMEHLSEET